MTCKKNKESFLTLFSFLIIGLFSFSIGCSKDDSKPFSAENPHLSFGIRPLNNSGADHQVQQLRMEDKKIRAGQLTPSSVGKLGLLSQFNPFLSESSNLVTLQQTADPQSDETQDGDSTGEHPPKSSNFCNIDGLNAASAIVQKDAISIPGESLPRAAEDLDYVAHGYIEAESQNCFTLRFIEDLYNSDTHRTKSEVDGREANEITIESASQNKTATWVKDNETQEVQVRVYTLQDDNIEVQTGVDIINDREGDEPFKKWIHLVTKAYLKNGVVDNNPKLDIVQRIFFLHQEPENEEPSHIVGSIRFTDGRGETNPNRFTLALSKLIKEFGAVVYLVKTTTTAANNFDDDCTGLTLDKKYYGPTGEELSAEVLTKADPSEEERIEKEALTQLQEKLGDHAISDLVSKLPEDSLKTTLANLSTDSETNNLTKKCGFKDIDSLLKVKDADDFEFAEPPEE